MANQGSWICFMGMPSVEVAKLRETYAVNQCDVVDRVKDKDSGVLGLNPCSFMETNRGNGAGETTPTISYLP